MILGLPSTSRNSQEIKEERKSELMDSIDAILGTGALDHGTAGKVTRSTCLEFFRPLSERQNSQLLNDALKRSLLYSRGLIEGGTAAGSERADVVIYPRSP